jgi:hypothetical protein
MAAQLRQMNVSYVDHEDRLLLRISNSEDQEHRLWCTRRFTRLLLDQFEQEFQNEVVAAAPVPPEARKDVAQMQHSQAVKEESFQKPYEAEPTEYPLGEDGLLVTTLKYGKNDKGVMSMSLSDGKDKSMTVKLNSSLQHQFYELLRRAAEKANWFAPPSASELATASGVVH